MGNSLAIPLDKAGVKLLGTPAKMIDNAEDRMKFSDMIDEIGVQQPQWRELTSVDSALDFAKNVGYPVLVRPSYVLSGAAMNVAVLLRTVISSQPPFTSTLKMLVSTLEMPRLSFLPKTSPPTKWNESETQPARLPSV